MKYLARLACASAFAMAALAASSAGAVTVIPMSNWTGHNGSESLLVSGAFDDEITFNTAENGLVSAGLLAAAVTGGPGIKFASVTLNNVSMLETKTGLVDSFSTTDQPSAAGQQVLHFIGSVVGKGMIGVGASAAFSVVPEASAWAMLILGAFFVGASLRRQRRSAKAIRA